MTNSPVPDNSNGYEAVASVFIAQRNLRIGTDTVREWSRSITRGCAVLDLGCGHGLPISQILVEQGFAVYGVDASPTLIAEFQRNLPMAQAEYSSVEDSLFFGRTFDAVVAVGLIFLLPTGVQRAVIHKVARALNPGGRFLFTAPKEPVSWRDSLTGCLSKSLGSVEYEHILRAERLRLDGNQLDEGGNYYYFSSKP